MYLDELSCEGFFTHLQKMGYTGTKEAWFKELMLQISESEIRFFRESRLLPCYERYSGLKEFVDKVFDLALPRFDKVKADSSGYSPYVTFDLSHVRRKLNTPRPLKIDGLVLNFEDQDERCIVRIRVYVNTLLRKDRSIIFNLKECEEEDIE